MIRQILFGSGHELPIHLQKLLEESGCNLEHLRHEIERTSSLLHHDVPLADRRLFFSRMRMCTHGLDCRALMPLFAPHEGADQAAH